MELQARINELEAELAKTQTELAEARAENRRMQTCFNLYAHRLATGFLKIKVDNKSKSEDHDDLVKTAHLIQRMELTQLANWSVEPVEGLTPNAAAAELDKVEVLTEPVVVDSIVVDPPKEEVKTESKTDKKDK